jgi:hypothetical protein
VQILLIPNQSCTSFPQLQLSAFLQLPLAAYQPIRSPAITVFVIVQEAQ